ncbi:hypothetical protein [Echinococcus multilocularis]|uniref:Secreted protein n=1 Tax=Echinococcus multilocularis TaxID=6211 RepID=A0A0S4MNZ5_ECHMU|nr:hypothetical protein [Echinococcus multilocularis]
MQNSITLLVLFSSPLSSSSSEADARSEMEVAIPTCRKKKLHFSRLRTLGRHPPGSEQSASPYLHSLRHAELSCASAPPPKENKILSLAILLPSPSFRSALLPTLLRSVYTRDRGNAFSCQLATPHNLKSPLLDLPPSAESFPKATQGMLT